MKTEQQIKEQIKVLRKEYNQMTESDRATSLARVVCGAEISMLKWVLRKGK